MAKVYRAIFNEDGKMFLESGGIVVTTSREVYTGKLNPISSEEFRTKFRTFERVHEDSNWTKESSSMERMNNRLIHLGRL